MHDDPTLLSRFVQQRDQAAFRELVERHVGLVYSAAIRLADGSSAVAQDAAQETFLRLAKQARELTSHPSLAGWLHTTACHCAREQLRSERRRQQRELTAHTMSADHSPETNDETWQRMRPVIDDALLELDAADRSAVLQRYFENAPFAAVGAALGLGENAARMRVERALERLQAALAKRGVVSTAAALATALSVPGAIAAPAGLAGQIFSTLATSGALGATAIATTSTGFFAVMSSAKTIATVSTLIAVAALGTALYQRQELADSRASAESLRREQSSLQARTTELENQLAALRTAAKAPTTSSTPDSTPVTKAVAVTTPPAVPTPPPATESEITPAIIQARFNRAKELARSGKHAEALAEYLWLYDKGMKLVTSFGAVRNSFLTSSLGELGKSYPPAIAALQARRDAAEKRVVSDGTDNDALGDYSALNAALGENDRSLVLFDSLPAGDPRRSQLAYSVADALIESRRYQEYLDARPYVQLRRMFEVTSDTSRFKSFTEEQRQTHKLSMVKSNAKNVEVLAGAGDLENAREFIGKLLAADSSSESRTLIQRHLERAGHPELMPAAPAPTR